jgi:hypothetical protein
MLHGNVRADPKAHKDLTIFAGEIGWDVEGMRKDGHDWRPRTADNGPYAPNYLTPMSIIVPLGPDTGSPGENGTISPLESSADTTMHAMLGSSVLSKLPGTRDAWIQHLQRRLLKPGETPADRPIVVPRERVPITSERRTGADILYPRTQLPEIINIRAVCEPALSPAR